MLTFNEIKNFELNGLDQIDGIRMAARAMAEDHSFNEVKTEEVALVVTELATNMIKFAGKGEIMINKFEINGRKGLDVFGQDHGPGIENLEITLRDGYSSVGSLGVGIGGIKRLSDEFDCFSLMAQHSPRQVDGFTVFFSRKWAQNKDYLNNHFELGYISRPFPGEIMNGDHLFIHETASGLIAAVVDGIGHGKEAAFAAQTAVEYMAVNTSDSIDEILVGLHQSLMHTRGAVVSVAKFEMDKKQFTYGGIGNIYARVENSPHPVHPVSLNGTLGSRIGKIRSFEYPWVPGSVLIMSSDGISNRWNMEDFPSLIKKHPALIAYVIYHNHCRTNDDASIMIIK
ncbi:MAG: ATP-binding protein [Bacteroidetes bacterium]|nr:ATP-binding protein [Bacteroidota bacterium]MBL6963820.1 ATP-binding protein [Bacteroidota bacterium]